MTAREYVQEKYPEVKDDYLLNLLAGMQRFNPDLPLYVERPGQKIYDWKDYRVKRQQYDNIETAIKIGKKRRSREQYNWDRYQAKLEKEAREKAR